MAKSVVSERQPTCLVEMMQRLGIEPGGGVVPQRGLSYATAMRRCLACQAKEACRAWLDAMPESVPAAPRFCPNADILFELRVDQVGIDRLYAQNHCASVADLERFEDELDDLLIQKAADDPMIADLKRRREQLRDEIEWLRHKAGPNRLSH
jgi:hypothetical protein